MKKSLLALSVLLLISATLARAEVYDLDALTDGYDDTDTNTEAETSNTNTNVDTSNINAANTNTIVTDVSEQAVTLAECLIYERLEIEDAQCDKLMATLQCPDYASYLDQCEQQHQVCLQNIPGSKGSVTYSACLGFFKSCTDLAIDTYPACAKKFQPRQPDGQKMTSFTLSSPVGDVRMYYEDNPTPADMESVQSTRTIQTGAAIFTGDTGSVTLTLPNGVTQWLGPNTYFRIADYFAGDTLSSTYTILENGNVVVGIEHLEDNTNVAYTVITPLWKVSAKGTEFAVTVADDGTETVAVTSGVVEMVDHLGVEFEEVTAGETITSDASGRILSELDKPTTLNTNVTNMSIIEDIPPYFEPDPWYTNVWGWFGVAVVLVLLGLFGITLTVIIVMLVRRRKQQ